MGAKEKLNYSLKQDIPVEYNAQTRNSPLPILAFEKFSFLSVWLRPSRQLVLNFTKRN